MGTYNLPRNVKGEGRILLVFSTKALIYTFVGIVIGLPFYFLFNAINMSVVGIIIIAFLGIIGFCIATFKVPDSSAFKLTKSTGGEKIDDVIMRYIKFKMAKNRIYTSTKGEIKNINRGGKENE